MRPTRFLLHLKPLLTILIIFIAAFLLLNFPNSKNIVPHAQAASFTLFGRVVSPAGWGISSTTVTNPGPTLTVTAGETVSLTLFSGDSASHQFCVDYEAVPDFSCQGTELPTESPVFSSSTVATQFSFTANTIPGSYTYFCVIHGSAMQGAFRVLPQAASFSLFGRVLAPAGWGSTSTTVTNPGPTLTVFAGETVSLSLFSGDSMQHQFCVDFEAVPDFICNGNEVSTQSPIFSSSTVAARDSFTAPTTPGNYTYFCTIHQDAMAGILQVLPQPASFTLYGRVVAPAGWGSSPTTVTNPGPTLVVSAGQMVSLTLFSPDSAQHRFCVDYEAVPDFICQGTELPTESPTFSSPNIAAQYSFTANTIPGDYTYFCTIHQSMMQGIFRVLPVPDVAVTRIATSRSFAYTGVSIVNPIQVNVTASNVGNQTETFFVSAKANSTLVGNQTVTLMKGQSSNVTFSWNPSTLTKGIYILTAQATKVAGEVNFANNAYTGTTNFVMRLKGDVNGDCKVDIIDLSTVGAAFGSSVGSAAYKPIADLNNDGTVNIIDLVIVAGAFGTIC